MAFDTQRYNRNILDDSWSYTSSSGKCQNQWHFRAEYIKDRSISVDFYSSYGPDIDGTRYGMPENVCQSANYLYLEFMKKPTVRHRGATRSLLEFVCCLMDDNACWLGVDLNPCTPCVDPAKFNLFFRSLGFDCLKDRSMPHVLIRPPRNQGS